jgi:hypothetical protein
MILLFLGLMLANFIFLIAATVIAYTGVGPGHRLIGALAAIVCTAVHCIVFTYFIATAKWIEHAIAVKHLDPAIFQQTRRFKKIAFPAALSAMALAITTAIIGGAVDNHYLSPAWHHVLAMLLLAGNIAAAAVEYRAIRDNGKLIDTILGKIEATSR